MFSRSQTAHDTTLASLNTFFYSPTSPMDSGLWSLDTHSPVAQLGFDDDFQSNTPFQDPNSSVFSSMPSTGLGIFYPSAGRTFTREDTYDLRAGSELDAAYRPRVNLRTGSSYGTDFTMDTPREESTPDPFSLSSLLITTEYLRDDLELLSNEPVIETKQETIPSSAPAFVDEQGRWVLQQILEASGHTVGSLTAESKTRLGDIGCSSPLLYTLESSLQSNAAYSPNVFLRYPRDSPVLGVNPSAIMPVQQLCPVAQLETPTPEPATGGDSEAANPSLSLTMNTTCPNDTEALDLPMPLTAQNLEQFEETFLPCKRESDYEPSISPRSEFSNESGFMPTFSKRKVQTRSSKAPGRRNVQRTLTSPYIIPSDPITDGPAILSHTVDYGTPVLDAHRGIELDELKAKAERYRGRNQGLEYDKKWLLSFAGKLTPQGLMTEEYRCYIIGCNQSNRRRDHILIHVGGHLDQRPFACTHCPARFLRKNECKRHELSHSGARPFTCNICPFGATAFVRQDLLKRHQKRTHNLDNTRSRKTKRHRQH